MDEMFEEDLIEKEFWDRHFYLQRKIRFHQTLVGISLSFSAVFFISGFYTDDKFLGFISFPREYSYLSALACFLVSLGWLTYMYVQGGLRVSQHPAGVKVFKSTFHEEDYSERVVGLEKAVASLSARLQSFDLGNRDALIDETVSVIKKTAHEKIWEELSEAVSKEGMHSRALIPIEKEYEKSKQRLLAEVQALGKRGSVNLALGVVTTATALMILSSLALSSVSPQLYNPVGGDFKFEVVTLLMFFVPKISLAVFIQIFSLFFLRLYKTGLAEIKYFQNEITNLELKYFGIVTSVMADDREAICGVGKMLLKVERNHVLTAGQTTVELEKHKIEQASSSEIIKLLPKILGRKSV